MEERREGEEGHLAGNNFTGIEGGLFVSQTGGGREFSNPSKADDGLPVRRRGDGADGTVVPPPRSRRCLVEWKGGRKSGTRPFFRVAAKPSLNKTIVPQHTALDIPRK